MGIALFALASLAGAIASPVAGRLAERGLAKPTTAIGLPAAIAAYLITHLSPEGTAIAFAPPDAGGHSDRFRRA